MTRTAVLSLLTALTACSTSADLGEATDAAVSDGHADVPSWPVPGQRNARSLRSDGAYLYWMVDEGDNSVIKRCEKRDCGGTQTSFARFTFAGHLGLEIRGDTLYAVTKQAILRCAVADCREPKALISSIAPDAVAFDDDNVYWSPRVEAKIFACSLRECATPRLLVTTGTPARELAADETQLFWNASETSYIDPPTAVFSMPKDGSSPPRQIAARQNKAASLVVRDGFVYWATSFTLGAVARCPLAGCPNGEPEVLAERQHYPRFVEPDGDALFWMNGASAPDSSNGDRPVQLLHCRLPNCSASTEVLDEGRGGGFGVRADDWRASWVALPAREMVVDSDAVYWFGDIVNAVPSPPAGSPIDAALRRTERRPLP